MGETLPMREASPRFNSRIRSLLMTSLGMLRASRAVGAEDAPLPEPSLPIELGSIDAAGHGDYRLIELIGQGQSARVFRAIHRRLSDTTHTRTVAVKIFRALRSTEEFEAVRAEALRADRVRADQVVRVFDVGLWQERWPYVVQDFWSGPNLEEWAEASFADATRLPSIERCVRIMLDAAKGVRAAHEQEIIHRDIAPRNILVCNDGVTRITDFGCAALGERESDDTVVGTPGFMPPEQWRRGAQLKQSDIAALGGILYWLVTGRLPYGESSEEIARAHEHPGAAHAARADALAESDVPAAIAEAILGATDPDLLRRTLSVEEFIASLEAWLRSAQPIRRAWRPGRRSIAAAASLAVAVWFAMQQMGGGEMPRSGLNEFAAWAGRPIEDNAVRTLYLWLTEWGAVEPVSDSPPVLAPVEALALARANSGALRGQGDVLALARVSMACAAQAVQLAAWDDADLWLAMARDAMNDPRFAACSVDESYRVARSWPALHAMATIHHRTKGGLVPLSGAFSEVEAVALEQSLGLGTAVQTAPIAGFVMLGKGTQLAVSADYLRMRLADEFPALRENLERQPPAVTHPVAPVTPQPARTGP